MQADTDPINLEEALTILDTNAAKERESAERLRASARDETNALKNRLDAERDRLRAEFPTLTGTAIQAISHHYGGELLDHPEWTGIYCQLERELQEACKHGIAPIVIRYTEYFGEYNSEEHDKTILAFVEPEHSDALFISEVIKDKTYSFAFSSQEIDITRSRLALRAHVYEDYGNLDELAADASTGQTLELSTMTRADDGPRRSMSAYSYSDHERRLLGECSYGNEDIKVDVGWNVLEDRVRRYRGKDREAVLGVLYDCLEHAGLLESSGIPEPFKKVWTAMAQYKESLKELNRHP
ncbi:MAG: hypothetical protein KDD62_11240 [Bdellovibrionales bacterium]|nr:hypothetical protein [Bdellovibrionales bacterium]